MHKTSNALLLVALLAPSQVAERHTNENITRRRAAVRPVRCPARPAHPAAGQRIGIGDIVAIDFMARVFSAKSPEAARKACFTAAANLNGNFSRSSDGRRGSG